MLNDEKEFDAEWVNVAEGRTIGSFHGHVTRSPAHSRRRLCLEDLITLGKRDPRLLAPRPDVPRWPQPGRIIQGAGPHPNHAVPRSAANP